MLISTDTWVKLEKAARDVTVNPSVDNMSELQEVLDYLESIRSSNYITLRYHGVPERMGSAVSAVRSLYSLRLTDIFPLLRAGKSFSIPIMRDGHSTDEDIQRLRDLGFEVEFSS